MVQQVRLGGTGLQVSDVWLGMMSYGDPAWRDWVLDEAAAEPFVARALEAGITTFDTADTYSSGVSEEVTGRLLGKLARRDEVVIATKVFFQWRDGPNNQGLSRKRIMESIDASLRRLETDHVDLYQIHRWDPETPIEETMQALHDVVRAGKARYLGASSMYAWQFAKAQEVARANGWTPFVSMQNHWNLLYREEEREMVPLCRDQGIGIVPWSPLARGVLARPWDDRKATARGSSDGFTPHLYDDAERVIVDRVGEVAERLDVPRAQVGLAWLRQQDGVTAPIVGATKLRHLEDAIASTDLTLSADDLAFLAEPYAPRPVLGHS